MPRGEFVWTFNAICMACDLQVHGFQLLDSQTHYKAKTGDTMSKGRLAIVFELSKTSFTFIPGLFHLIPENLAN